ncbi:MAG: PorT family protein [Bacteroidetes bacterium]|nr:PorT family protein [Bacteroidota bacterium]
MRKIILLSFVCISSHLLAQKSFFGVDAGVNVANQRFVTIQTPPSFNFRSTVFFENSIRPAFGLFFQHNFSELIGIRFNAQFMGMGYTDKNQGRGSINIDYLTFPVILKYYVNKHLSLDAGTFLSFTLGGTRINNQIITKTYHENDSGLSIGGEQDIYKNFSLGVNYFIGLKNILLADTNGFGTSYKYSNRALQFTLIYKFKKNA